MNTSERLACTASRKPSGKPADDGKPTNTTALDLGYLPGKSNAEIRKRLQKKLDLIKLHKTSFVLLMVDVLGIYGSFSTTGLILLYAADHFGLMVTLALLPLTSLFNARALRGAEHYVHEGSHGNVSRPVNGGPSSFQWNDLLTDVLFSTLIFQTVQAYRTSHMRHHSAFASDMDPCRKMRAGLAALRAAGGKSRLRLAVALLRALPDYSLSYYREVGSRKTAIWRSALAHGTVIAALCLCMGPWIGLCLWFAVFALPFATALQALRALGEASEHDYGEPQLTEGAATYNNLGWFQRMFVNPFGDCYHWIHHELPSVPSYRFRSVHNALADDEIYRSVRTRLKILEEK